MSAAFFLAEFTDDSTGTGARDLLWLPTAEAEKAFFHQCHAWAVRRSLAAAEAGTGVRPGARPEAAAGR
jgi:hypothetical protein